MDVLRSDACPSIPAWIDNNRAGLWTTKVRPERWPVATPPTPVKSLTGSNQQSETFDDLLRALRGEEFSRRTLTMIEGHEARTLRSDPDVVQLANAIRQDPAHASARIEAFLDDLFEDLRDGEDFPHADLVMGILVALQLADSPQLAELAPVFAESKGVEIGRLRRFAKRLLKG